jgi:hypothetical protein
MHELLAVGVDALVTNRADLALPITRAASGVGRGADADADGGTGGEVGIDTEGW